MSKALFKYLSTAKKESSREEEEKSKPAVPKLFALPSANIVIRVNPVVVFEMLNHKPNRFTDVTAKRGVGVLFGVLIGNKLLNVNCSYAVPFDEESDGSDVFFVDLDSVRSNITAHSVFRKNETMVGWYHTGGKMCANDSKINKHFAKIIPTPIQIICNPRSGRLIHTIRAIVHRDTVLNIEGINLFEPITVLRSTILPEKRMQLGMDLILKQERISNREPVNYTPEEQFESTITRYWKKLDDMHRVANYLGAVSMNSLPPNDQINDQIQKLKNKLPPTSEALLATVIRSKEKTCVKLTLASLARCLASIDELIENRYKLQKVLKQKSTGGKQENGAPTSKAIPGKKD
ncbi:26S proteasome non ATPase regulatory subunit 7 [Trichuris trichiura]|uniref:26S proteasome non ATPase regulatory subunit 7 n=1 Tax=Trichuris trichiura TaxID=36087 RepID=A0A077Z5D0_TRITR|nr:26S proteasome non ATPase regulatory subunit 7 [Trichuris trichiura]